MPAVSSWMPKKSWERYNWQGGCGLAKIQKLYALEARLKKFTVEERLAERQLRA